jgi:hypothetical protein
MQSSHQIDLVAGAKDVEDGVEDVPHISFAGLSAGVDRDVRLDQGLSLVVR